MARSVLKRDEGEYQFAGQGGAGTYFVPKARKGAGCDFRTTRQQDREVTMCRFKVAEKQLVDG